MWDIRLLLINQRRGRGRERKVHISMSQKTFLDFCFSDVKVSSVEGVTGGGGGLKYPRWHLDVTRCPQILRQFQQGLEDNLSSANHGTLHERELTSPNRTK